MSQNRAMKHPSSPTWLCTPTAGSAHPTLGSRRRFALGLLTCSLLPLSACESKPMSVTLEVVLFSYLDRPIFDVLLNGQDIGVSNAYPTTGGGSISGLPVRLGPAKVSWRLGGPEGMSRNGETVHAKNSPTLDKVEREHRFLGVHILPDDTVELAVSTHYPGRLARGIAMNEARKRAIGP